MTIIRLIFAAALASFAVANVDEVSNDAEIFAEATAFVQSFSSMKAQGDSACLKVADDAIKVIADECKTLQGVIDTAAKANQKCCKSGSQATCNTKSQHDTAVKAHSTCLSQLASIKKKTVNLGTVSYSSLAGKTCYNHNSNSAFQAIKSEVEKKTQECYKKSGSKDAAKKTYDDAVKAAASSRSTCNADGQTSLTKAFTKGKAACGSATNLKAFKRAEHMKCVLKGTNLADCSKNMPKPPAVKETTQSTLNCAAQTGDPMGGQCHSVDSMGALWSGSTCKDSPGPNQAGVRGFRIQKGGGGKIAYLYASPGTAWVRNKNYGCPQGWHFGTRAEFKSGCKGGSAHNGYGHCGCSGYSCGGANMERFRFSDSKSTCQYAHMGSGECGAGHSSCGLNLFAGIICIKN